MRVDMRPRLARPRAPGNRPLGIRPDAYASGVDALNTLRNRASIAHPNEGLLDREEAYLYVNAVRTLMAYIDAKLEAAVDPAT